MTLTWTKLSDFAIRAGQWTLSKVVVCGRAQYELWRDGQAAIVARFDSAGEGKDFARRAENARAHLGEND